MRFSIVRKARADKHESSRVAEWGQSLNPSSRITKTQSRTPESVSGLCMAGPHFGHFSPPRHPSPHPVISVLLVTRQEPSDTSEKHDAKLICKYLPTYEY